MRTGTRRGKKLARVEYCQWEKTRQGTEYFWWMSACGFGKAYYPESGVCECKKRIVVVEQGGGKRHAVRSHSARAVAI